MKKRIMLIVLALITLLGCSGITFDRKVENNTFTSMADPVVQIRVSPSLGYLGKISTARHHQNINGAKGLVVNYNSYLFLDMGKDNLIRRGVVIRVDKIGKGSWESDLFADVKNKLSSDFREIGGKRYEHFIAVRSDIFTDDEMDFVVSRGARDEKTVMKSGKATYSGYVLPKCFMVEAFGIRAGAGSDTRMCVYYFDDIEEIDGGASCKDWLRGEMPPEDQERVKTVFMKSREGALTFVEKRK